MSSFIELKKIVLYFLTIYFYIAKFGILKILPRIEKTKYIEKKVCKIMTLLWTNLVNEF